MEKLGLGPKELTKLYPKLIYASCSGFGEQVLGQKTSLRLNSTSFGWRIMSLTGIKVLSQSE